MAQVRFYNFGDTLTSARFTTSYKTLFEPGVYSGYDISVIDAVTLEMSVGYLMLPDGVVLSETTPVRMSFSVLPSVATVFTITAQHTDANLVGGVAASYNLLTGYFAKGSLADSTVIAWIYHPCSAAPLASCMIVQPDKEKLSPFFAGANANTPDHFSPPFADGIIQLAAGVTVSPILSTLVPLQAGTGWPQTQITNSNLVTSAATFVFSQRVVRKPSRIEVTAKLSIGATLAINVYDTAGNVVAVGTPLFGPFAGSAWQVMYTTIPLCTLVAPPPPVTPYVDNGVWTTNNLWRIELAFSLPASSTSYLAGVTAFYDPNINS